MFNVAILVTYSYMVFAILGMSVWSGRYHSHCRLTEFPVQLNFDPTNATSSDLYPNQTWIDIVTREPTKYACPRIDVHDGVWSKPERCFWPTDPLDNTIGGRYCGHRQCRAGTFCGSNFDIKGNPRFYNIDVMESPRKIISVMDEPDFTPNLNFGLTSFDDFFHAFVIIIQAVTASGWMVLTENVKRKRFNDCHRLFFYHGSSIHLSLSLCVTYSDTMSFVIYIF